MIIQKIVFPVGTVPFQDPLKQDPHFKEHFGIPRGFKVPMIVGNRMVGIRNRILSSISILLSYQMRSLRLRAVPLKIQCV